jgi:hypothetical protein
MKRALDNWLYRDMNNLTLGRDPRETGAPWRKDVLAEWRQPYHTMAGFKRLDNVQYCVERVLEDDVPGDLLEAGVWRGGVSILMRAILAVRGVTTRRVWVADSFEGLPPPDPVHYPADAGLVFHLVDELRVSVDHVRANFERYGLLDDQVRFLKGWFKDTLKTAPIERLAVLRLDGDLYESTMDGLVLYDKVSPGGFVIIDDYGAISACRQAVHDFRRTHGITDPVVPVDWTAAYWRKSSTGWSGSGPRYPAS